MGQGVPGSIRSSLHDWNVCRRRESWKLEQERGREREREERDGEKDGERERWGKSTRKSEGEEV